MDAGADTAPQQLHVVVGAGVVGRGVAELLAAEGHRVRVITRSGGGPQHPLVERVAADASDADRLTDLATGAAALYNCANPSYHRWPKDWPPLAAALLTAAERTGAVLATCSNLYIYGPVDRPITEDLPLAATGAKGRVRRQMWLDALAAHRAGRARVTEVRASSYLSPGSPTAFDGLVVPALLKGRAVRLPGRPDQPHSLTWTGDVTRALVTVARTERAWGRAWHVPTAPPRTQEQAIADLAAALGVPASPLRPVPRWVFGTLGLMVPALGEFREVLHQYERPWVIDASAAERELGLRATPWSEAVAAVAAAYRSAAAA